MRVLACGWVPVWVNHVRPATARDAFPSTPSRATASKRTCALPVRPAGAAEVDPRSVVAVCIHSKAGAAVFAAVSFGPKARASPPITPNASPVKCRWDACRTATASVAASEETRAAPTRVGAGSWGQTEPEGANPTKASCSPNAGRLPTVTALPACAIRPFCCPSALSVQATARVVGEAIARFRFKLTFATAVGASPRIPLNRAAGRIASKGTASV